MVSSTSSAANIAAILARFPQELLLELLEGLIARSAVLRAQSDASGSDCSFQVPTGAGRSWVQCVMSTNKALKAQDDAQLVQYLQASEFFQDSEKVNSVCLILGARLFEPQARHSCTQHQSRAAQVLEELPQDLAVEVVRSAPGSLDHKLQNLPEDFGALAAHANIPGIAAACCPTEGSALNSSADLPSFDLCVAIPPDELRAPHSDDVSHSVTTTLAKECILEREAEITETNLQNGLFSLKQVQGAVACYMQASKSTVQHVTIVLQQNECIVLGRNSAAIKLSHVTFEGGSVVFLGGRCTMSHVSFKGCSLLVLAGAHAELEEPVFTNHSAGISLFVHGAGTDVSVHGGSITGGTQGVSVQAGGRLEATDLTITDIWLTGVEVKDQSSSLKLAMCKLDNFHNSMDGNYLRGVFVHSSSTAVICSLSLTCPAIDVGVDVRTNASTTLTDCNVSHARSRCVGFGAGGTGRLERCSLSDSSHLGLYVDGDGSSAEDSDCRLLRNGSNGMFAQNGGGLTAHTCTSSDNGQAGYAASGGQIVMVLISCTSHRDRIGCFANAGAKLTARKVVVHDSEDDGFYVGQGEAMLQECTACTCGENGVLALGSNVEMEGCSLEQNGDCGACATEDSVVLMRGCRSSQNRGEGYFALCGAQMRVIDCSSDADKIGCGVSEGGKLTMEALAVDGVCQSGTLP